MAKKNNPMESELVNELAEALEEHDFQLDSKIELDEPEPAVEAPKVSKPVFGSYELVEGDSWPSVAAKNPLAGKTKHERATELAAKYGEAVAGKVVEL